LGDDTGVTTKETCGENQAPLRKKKEKKKKFVYRYTVNHKDLGSLGKKGGRRGENVEFLAEVQKRTGATEPKKIEKLKKEKQENPPSLKIPT